MFPSVCIKLFLKGRGVSDEEVRQICYQILREQMEDIVADLRGPPGPPGEGKSGSPGQPGPQGLTGKEQLPVC